MKCLRPLPSSAVLAILTITTLFAAPCLAAPKPVKPAPAADNPFDSLPDSKNPIGYKSPEGRFEVTFPTGCARLRTRTNMRPDQTAEVTAQVNFVTCDRANVKNEGCSVVSMLGVARGLKGQEAADKVLDEVSRQLAGYDVKPIKQTPLRRDFGKHGVVEGIDIQAQRTGGSGDFWVRGLLLGDDIYIVLAWKASGGLWTDPEFALFFDSFRPWVD